MKAQFGETLDKIRYTIIIYIYIYIYNYCILYIIVLYIIIIYIYNYIYIYIYIYIRERIKEDASIVYYSFIFSNFIVYFDYLGIVPFLSY